MADQVQFDFAVPDELLQEVVARSGHTECVADLSVMPGTGEGKPPPLLGVLRQNGFAPLVLLTAAAIVPGHLRATASRSSATTSSTPSTSTTPPSAR